MILIEKQKLGITVYKKLHDLKIIVEDKPLSSTRERSNYLNDSLIRRPQPFW